MRPVAETREPDLLEIANTIVPSYSSRVSVLEALPGGPPCVVLYKQPIHYRDSPFLSKLMWWKTKSVTTSINEMLIYLGAAEFAPDQGALPNVCREACQKADQQRRTAIGRGYSAVKLERLKKNPASLYWYDKGHKESLPAGDRRSRPWRTTPTTQRS